MTSVFGQDYADAYDSLYGDKDYEQECDLVEQLMGQYSTKPIHSVLDLGCGTGSHAIPLAKRGHKVAGVDVAEAMLTRARSKVGPGVDISFHLGDVRTVRLNQTFDAALMMFAVLGYQHENEDILAALKTARSHLHDDGVFVFDVWYGPAVLNLRPSDRVKVIPVGDGRLIRAASGELDVQRNLCKVSYHLWHLVGDRLVNETEETHLMRYFFAQDLQLFCALSGLKLVHLSAFPSLDQTPDEQSWNIFGVATAASLFPQR